MLFHTIVSRLVVGVCLLKFVTVGAMPTGSGKAPLGKTLVPGKVVDPLFEEKWWKQVEVDWIDIDPDEKKRWICQGYDKNNEVFATDLNDQLEGKLTLGRLSGFAPIEGNNNKGIYTLFNSVKVDSIPGSSLVVKLVELERKSASCEVFALKALATLQQQQHKAPLFVTSGHMMHKKVKRGVIILRKVPGTPLQDIKDWRNGSNEIKLTMMRVVYNSILRQNYDLVQTKKLVHIDPDPSNILVDHPEDNLLDANLIDYGAPSVYPVKRDITMEEFEKWFNERWYFLWFHEGS
ncbi:uncharacterized protein C8R40DRAFT_811526 [Lentinula edodes]|uniref:uncharacterized protein n=1 Tax=Lentinula edodes TaxID=5353 RepID=UPI001E8ED10A|nr:uncharacterized protein C8R40DRAFT_811526 [Lentinula edodes]KAH7868727.1 hypothetical protein C8R40DRAFT_811526 [Lentinula edodes]